jgi:predicted PurR-regulated permease PerM
MDGINTAVVGYLLLCMLWPHLVKSKAYYYLSLAAVLLYILLSALGACFAGYGISRAIAVVATLTCGFALVLAVLASGGLTIREFAGEMGSAFDAFRRGEDQDKPVIVPITGEQPKKRDEADPRDRYAVNDDQNQPH